MNRMIMLLAAITIFFVSESTAEQTRLRCSFIPSD